MRSSAPMTTGNPRARVSKQAGFSLLEILIAMFVMAIGMLGFAGLQTLTIKNNQSAYYRSQATILTDDILDRMRANITAARASEYNTAIGSAASGTGIALADLTEWKATMASELPRGDGAITVDGNGNAVIKIKWIENNLVSEDNNNPPCPGPSTPPSQGIQVFCSVSRL